MYFSYVPSIIFSFFNHPLFLNLLFKQILIQYYSILFIRVLSYLAGSAPGRPTLSVWTVWTLRTLLDSVDPVDPLDHLLSAGRRWRKSAGRQLDW